MRKQQINKIQGLIFSIVGGIFLILVLAKFALWIMLVVAGYKLLSEGLRLQGYPPITFMFTRWFF